MTTDLSYAYYTDPADGARVVATFLYEGFRDVYDRRTDEEQLILGTYIGGAVEQAYFVSGYADTVVSAVNDWMGEHKVVEWSGVLEYEVVNAVGCSIAWWMVRRAARGKVPTQAKVYKWAQEAAADFFGSTNMATPEVVVELTVSRQHCSGLIRALAGFLSMPGDAPLQLAVALADDEATLTIPGDGIVTLVIPTRSRPTT